MANKKVLLQRFVVNISDHLFIQFSLPGAS